LVRARAETSIKTTTTIGTGLMAAPTAAGARIPIDAHDRHLSQANADHVFRMRSSAP